MKFIESREELRTVYREADGAAARKELRFLDVHSRNFIAKSPFVVIGTQDATGNADVTPKGDKPGFVAVLDDVTLAIPDRPGNNRLDTFENLLANPAIGLIFLIPGMNETLRVNGEARITVDETLRERFVVDGRAPVSVVVVKVRSAFMHCAKAFMRSQLWKPDTWPARSEMPTLGAILRDQLALAESVGELDEWLDDAYAKSMW